MALAGAASNGFGREPMSVASITSEAANFEYDPSIPLRYWFRTADAIQKQAQSYERDGHDQDAYLFYMRHALLASERLPKHVDYKAQESVVARKRLQRALLRDLEVLETLKPGIQERFERYTKAMAKRKEEREEWVAQNPSQAPLARDMGRVSLSGQEDTGHRRERRELDTGKDEDRALALSLANKELRRRRQETSLDEGDNNDLAQWIAATARRSEQAHQERNGHATNHDRNQQAHSAAYNYPSVPSKKAHQLDTNFTQPRPAPQRPPKEYFEDPRPPPLPKKSFSSVTPSPAYAPPVPSKHTYDSNTIAPTPRESTATPNLSTRDYSFPVVAKTEAGADLRTLFINPDLRSKFLQIAQSNTNRNLETCGILCGELISGAFFISKLVIPEQESTSDTCDTVNESALFDYVDSHALMTLGWIHTHPTQTCFMSSRDLHTHSGYQVQMAESIAIVCAPRHEPAYGVFRLTDPPGLKTILHCTRSGLFHPHDGGGGGVYTDAMRPGHVKEFGGLEFEVVDLRPK